MSKKQLGSAAGEETGFEGPERQGWFGRLRAQPGFRTAAVAFVLTIVLGVGGSAAYALWSKTFPATITASTPILPAPEKPVCTDRGTTKVSWNPPADMPGDAVYFVEVTKIGKKSGSLIYAFPKGTTSFQPAYLSVGSERFDDWMDGTLLNQTSANITVSVGALASSLSEPVRLPAPIDPNLPRSALSPPVEILSKRTLGIPHYECS